MAKSDTSSRRVLSVTASSDTVRRVNDSNILSKIDRHHTLSKITVCGALGQGKVTGVQVEYGIFDATTNSFSEVVPGEVHGTISGSSCLFWNMSPARQVKEVTTTFNMFQVNYIEIIDN